MIVVGLYCVLWGKGLDGAVAHAHPTSTSTPRTISKPEAEADEA